jgi:hypothetical protein
VIALVLGGGLPKLVAPLVAMPGLAASTHLLVEPKRLVVTDFFAAGGDTSLRGLYVVRDASALGAFVASKGPLSAGLRVDGDGVHPRFFGLGGWFEAQSRAAMRLACGADSLDACAPVRSARTASGW